MNKQISLELAQELHEVAKNKGVDLPISEYGYYDTRKSWKRVNCKFEDGEYKFVPFYNLGQYDFECELSKRGLSTSPNTGCNDSLPLAAYDTNELLEWLPYIIQDEKTMELYELELFKIDDNEYSCSYMLETDYDGSFQLSDIFKAETPQDALCKLAIHLINNDLLK